MSSIPTSFDPAFVAYLRAFAPDRLPATDAELTHKRIVSALVSAAQEKTPTYVAFPEQGLAVLRACVAALDAHGTPAWLAKLANRSEEIAATNLAPAPAKPARRTRKPARKAQVVAKATSPKSSKRIHGNKVVTVTLTASQARKLGVRI